MDILLETCLAELREYHDLYKALFSTLEPLVQIIPPEKIDDKFSPPATSILQQIKHYPEGQYLLPPAAWVQPNRGQIEYNNTAWEYAFHGGGLSFFDHLGGDREVSVEFTAYGHVAFTMYTFQLYLETASLQKNEPIYRGILPQHENLLQQLTRQGYLIPLTPILIHDDYTYIFPEDLDDPDTVKNE